MTAAFDLHRPRSLDALHALLDGLARRQQRFAISAGGTDLVPQLKLGLATPEVLVSLGAIPALRGITREPDGRVRIGAMTPLATIIADPLLHAVAPVLGEAAARVASAPIRERATLGGNVLADHRCNFFNQSPLNRAAHGPCFKAGGDVCHIVKSAVRGQLPQCQARIVSDTTPALLVLDAELQMHSPRGERRIALADFHLGDGIERHRLAADEVLLAITLPSRPGRVAAYEKLAARANLDFPSLGIALARDGDRLHAAMTGIGVRPASARAALADVALATLGESLASANPVYDQDGFPRDYRKRMIAAYVRKAARRIGGDAWT